MKSFNELSLLKYILAKPNEIKLLKTLSMQEWVK